MSAMLDLAPYGPRDDARLLSELNALTDRHRAGCDPYARLAPQGDADSLQALPYVHVGVFKHLDLRTSAGDIRHGRTLLSSATSTGNSSKIAMDANSSALQSRSVASVLRDFVGEQRRPLLILDSSRSLRSRRQLSARIAAAMGLQPLASEMRFLLGDAGDPATMKWDLLADMLQDHDALMVYGFTWILWLAWGAAAMPDDVRQALKGKTLHFVHSGGWKKLEERKVDRERFDTALLDGLSADSRVIDYYGLVEQIGIIYPLCEHGSRHVPVWADVIVRDPWTGAALPTGIGQLQLLNTLALGAPYHSVLTEDRGRLLPGDCPCGRVGRRFELIGRLPKAEVGGCANV